ncbi:hypothetical protein PPYR_03232 [Photinus pyralis]|uniref:Fatty acyl-CoA reductase n=1 Tax=Photinus pyralis TaxID=7054 RepID=A0A5N4A295_PHOPY|nr:putative fatty acyl-CoA reductase CG5065 isoform X2 [Photinus pyralis]KAB0791432.1 hypothetical protein PPYR_03232 [Photinus pyralis]
MTPTVSEWFSDQHVLITGATGFMGKVLVEKLLRCCPKIATIYVLVRPKRGRNPQQRLEDFVNTPVFDRVRDTNVKLFQKLHCVSGDLIQSELGMSNDDIQLLQDRVTVVFHMAANVRFDQSLKTALVMNTGGTLMVLELIASFKRLRAFVHVSTSYCHCDETVLEERVYFAPHRPRKMLDLASWIDEDILKGLTPKFLKNSPNTYAYTKCLTEELVWEYRAKFPIAIVRPSIVIASWKEPMPGWIDNLNGPTGLLVGAGKGVIRSMHCDPSYEADLVPVDICTNSIILTAWKLGTTAPSGEPLVLNVTMPSENSITWGEALEMGRRHFYNNPFSVCLWYPDGGITSNYWVHAACVLLFHVIPAYLIDFLLILTRGKPFLVRTQKRIANGLGVLQYYTTRTWHFKNEGIGKIARSLTSHDSLVFYTSTVDLNWSNYLLSYVLGARKYCVHEEPSTIPYARKVLRRLYYLDAAKNIVFGAIFIWLTYVVFLRVLSAVAF